MKLKLHIDWKKAVVYLVVAAGLIYLTRSLLMSLGIMLLLIVADHLLADWDDTRRRKRETREWLESLKNNEPSSHATTHQSL